MGWIGAPGRGARLCTGGGVRLGRALQPDRMRVGAEGTSGVARPV